MWGRRRRGEGEKTPPPQVRFTICGPEFGEKGGFVRGRGSRLLGWSLEAGGGGVERDPPPSLLARPLEKRSGAGRGGGRSPDGPPSPLAGSGCRPPSRPRARGLPRLFALTCGCCCHVSSRREKRRRGGRGGHNSEWDAPMSRMPLPQRQGCPRAPLGCLESLQWARRKLVVASLGGGRRPPVARKQAVPVPGSVLRRGRNGPGSRVSSLDLE